MARIDITKHPRGMFHVALDDADVGDEIVYHIGEYAAGWHKRDALDAALGDKCFIYQRKLGKHVFEYCVKKSSKK